MTDVRKILYEICENEDVFSDDTDLIENGILDSYGMMALLSALEDEGIEINIARIFKSRVKSHFTARMIANIKAIEFHILEKVIYSCAQDFCISFYNAFL